MMKMDNILSELDQNCSYFPRESLDVLIGDTVAEGLPRIIASVFGGVNPDASSPT